MTLKRHVHAVPADFPDHITTWNILGISKDV